MIVVVAIISVLIIWIGYKVANKYNKTYSDDYGLAWKVVGVILLTSTLIVALITGINLSNKMIIDEKIDLYLSQNSKIEEQVTNTVTEYMSYEQETFTNIKPESAIALAQTYPELASNQIVQQQINLYISNNEKIRSLKEEKMDYKVYAWWLYFGK